MTCGFGLDLVYGYRVRDMLAVSTEKDFQSCFLRYASGFQMETFWFSKEWRQVKNYSIRQTIIVSKAQHSSSDPLILDCMKESIIRCSCW